MAPEHREMFAVLSILDIGKTEWSCQVIDPINECCTTCPISHYEGTRKSYMLEKDFSGPYNMTFEVDDRGRPLTLKATASVTSNDAEITNGNDLLLSPPSNHKLQMEPGIEPTGAYMWLRWMDGATVREFRLQTALNNTTILMELGEMGYTLLASSPI